MQKLLVAVFMLLALTAVQSRKVVVRSHKAGSLKQCILQNCRSQLQACAQDAGCVQTVQSCANQVQSGTATGQAALNNFETCLNANANAAGVWTCVKGSCLNSAMPQLFDLMNVMTQHVAGGSLKQCILQNCRSQLQACAQDAGCVQTVQSCANQVQSGTATGQAALNNFETCLNANANAAGVWTCVKGSCLNSALDFTLFTTMVSTHVADAGLKQCILQNCRSQLQACAQDSGCVQTVQSCANKVQPGPNALQTFETCLNANTNAAGVWTCVKGNCLKAASLEDLQLNSMALARHVADQKLKQCMIANCKTQIQACAKDTGCVQTIQSCANKVKPGPDALKTFETCLDANPNSSGVWKCVKTNCLKDIKHHKKHAQFSDRLDSLISMFDE